MLFPGLAFGRDLDFLQKSGVKRAISIHGVSEGRGLREQEGSGSPTVSITEEPKSQGMPATQKKVRTMN